MNRSGLAAKSGCGTAPPQAEPRLFLSPEQSLDRYQSWLGPSHRRHRAASPCAAVMNMWRQPSQHRQACRSAQEFRRQRPRQRAPLPHRLMVEPRNHRTGSGERALDPARHISRPGSRRPRSWRSANNLTNSARNSPSSGGDRATTGSARRRESRSRTAQRPSRRARACREQDERALLAGEIDEMQQRSLIEPSCRQVLDDQRAGRERGRNAGLLERCAPPPSARRPPAPRSSRQMALARAFRADEDRDGARPVRPRVDQRDRRRIRGAAEKILPRKLSA